VTAIIVLTLLVVAPVLWDKHDQRQKRRERRNMRRLLTYMAQVPPRRDW
jgi:preprotein translocase subunit SecY